MAKHCKETLGQFNDFKFFSLLEGKRAKKNDDNEKKMKDEDAKEGLEVIKKVQDNFERFKSAAGDKIIKYKEFWKENETSKEGFDAEGQIYKMFDSDYVVGTLNLPDEAVSDEEIDAEIEEVDKDPDADDASDEEVTETPEEEEEEVEDEGLVKESLNEADDLSLDFDEPSDEDPKLGAEDEAPELPAPDLSGEETEETPEAPEIPGDDSGPEGEEGEEGIEDEVEGEEDSEMDFKEEESTNEYFVVYNMSGEEREEVFRTDSPSVISQFKDFFENTFKGAMKEQILKFKQAQEDKKKEAELAAKEKQRAERKGKLDQFMKA